MALSEDSKPSNTKSQNTHIQKSDKREKPLSKVIIRRLPPSIDKETFLNQISPLPNYDYFYLVNGEAGLGENSFTRAYINFANSNDVFAFKEKFDNYVFLDHKGNEYAAVVEFAAFQKVPKRRNKARQDPKSGSIESDPYYLEFVENLNKPVEQEDKPEYSYQFSSESKENKDALTTPLLEFVKNRRVERMRIREERREERRRKEIERKKIREEERKKRFEEKSPTKVFSKAKPEDKETSDNEVKEEKPEGIDTKSEKYFEKPSSYRNKERKFEDRKKDIKSKPLPRKEYPEKREFRGRKEYFKESKYDSYKKEEKQFPKKMKKYSEKREERKMEAQRAEMKKVEEQEKKAANSSLAAGDSKEERMDKQLDEKSKNVSSSEKVTENIDLLEKDLATQVKVKTLTDDEKLEKAEILLKNIDKPKRTLKMDFESTSFKETPNSGEYGDGDSKLVETKEHTKESRKERIRNKDRPTIAIYRPGMLTKRKLTDGEEKESVKDAK